MPKFSQHEASNRRGESFERSMHPHFSNHPSILVIMGQFSLYIILILDIPTLLFYLIARSSVTTFLIDLSFFFSQYTPFYNSSWVLLLKKRASIFSLKDVTLVYIFMPYYPFLLNRCAYGFEILLSISSSFDRFIKNRKSV